LTVVDIGICSMQTHYTVQPVELARWAEAEGFDSVFFGEHSHLPAKRETRFLLEDAEMPDYFREISDPMVCMTAAAVVTERLKVGTSVCLVPERHPITSAKTVGCVDLVANGRLVSAVLRAQAGPTRWTPGTDRGGGHRTDRAAHPRAFCCSSPRVTPTPNGRSCTGSPNCGAPPAEDHRGRPRRRFRRSPVAVDARDGREAVLPVGGRAPCSAA
jgi:hypothetical protein